MEKPTTIELRNLDAYRGDTQLEVSPGDWTTNLSHQLQLNEGDTLFVKQSFIDTEASSSREVNVEEDITLHLAHYYYLVNTGIGNAQLVAFGGTTPSVDGAEHVSCALTQGADTDFRTITEMSFSGPDDGLTKALTFSIRSTDIDGVVRDTEPIKLPRFTVSYTLKNLNIIYKLTDTVVFVAYKGSLTKTEMNAKANVDAPELPSPAQPNPNPFKLKTAPVLADTFTPEIKTTSFVLKKGNYAPTDLCAVINRELNKNPEPDGNDIVRTQFLENTGDAFDAADPDTKYFSRNTDGAYIFSVGENPTPGGKGYNWLYGASLVNLDWNEDQGLFNWTYLHTPFYYQGKEVTAYASVQPAPPTPQAYPVDRYGGIIFRSLTATDSLGNRVDFWDNQLGFNVNHNTPGAICVYDTQITVGAITSFTIPTEVGVTVTTNFTGADSLVNKLASDTTGAFRLAPEPKDISSPDIVYSTSQYTNPVLASVSVFQQNNSYGYFLIEIDSNFSDEYVDTTSTNTKIKSVVSRFFERASYTAGTSSGSLIYTHQGPSQILSSFRCRILDSNKQLATGIGQDNTIFLQLVRAPVDAKKAQLHAH